MTPFVHNLDRSGTVGLSAWKKNSANFALTAF